MWREDSLLTGMVARPGPQHCTIADNVLANSVGPFPALVLHGGRGTLQTAAATDGEVWPYNPGQGNVWGNTISNNSVTSPPPAGIFQAYNARGNILLNNSFQNFVGVYSAEFQAPPNADLTTAYPVTANSYNSW
jgi:hypothetical protein